MKLLVITSRFPYPLEKGDKLRIYHQLRVLSQFHDITLISLTDVPVLKADIEEIQKYCHQIHIFKLGLLPRIWNSCLSFLKRWPLQVGYFYNPNIAQKIDKIINENPPDHLYVQLIRMTEYVKNIDITKTLDYMDCFSHSMALRQKVSPWWQKPFFKREAVLLSRYERKMAFCFDHLTIISKQDKKRIKVTKFQEIKVIPNGIDLNFFRPQKHFERKYDLVFVGNMGYFPNVHAAHFILKEILPGLLEARPQTTILIAGARPDSSLVKLNQPQVTVSGWMDDIREAYQSATVFIAPIYQGSGQQNKLLEAMALGLPCICTPNLNNAIGAAEGKDLVICHQPKEWISHICRLLEDKQRRIELGNRAQLFVHNNYSWENSTQALEELF